MNGAGEVAEQLRAWTGLAEDQPSVPNTPGLPIIVIKHHDQRQAGDKNKK